MWPSFFKQSSEGPNSGSLRRAKIKGRHFALVKNVVGTWAEGMRKGNGRQERSEVGHSLECDSGEMVG